MVSKPSTPPEFARTEARSSGVGPFDRESLLIRLGGSNEILVELAMLFCTESPRMQSELWDRLERRDVRAAMSSAHQLKGALLNLSAEPSASTARELEVCLRGGDWHNSLRRARRLDGELEQLVAALARERTAA
jgi:HPt (histidine-containing phosphotransfer) domain-containing protein